MAEAADRQTRTWAMLCHLSALVGVIGPLVVWLIQRNEHPFIEHQSKESLNFQISIAVYGLVGVIIMSAARAVGPMVSLFLLGVLLIAATAITNLVLIILATVSVGDGRPYRYPLTIRLVR